MSKRKRQWDIVKDRWKFESSDIDDTLDLKENENKTLVEKSKIQLLENFSRSVGNSDLIRLVQNLKTNPVAEIFKPYENHLQHLAARHHEKSDKVRYTSDSNDISFDDIKPIEGVLNHIFNNCFDHGILPAEEREMLGKPGTGTITISAFVVKGQIAPPCHQR